MKDDIYNICKRPAKAKPAPTTSFRSSESPSSGNRLGGASYTSGGAYDIIYMTTYDGSKKITMVRMTVIMCYLIILLIVSISV